MPQDWTYGAEGKAYPVQLGDVWQVGRHTFMCSDLMESRLLDNWAATHGQPTLVYADPPWNQSNVNSFRTKAGLDPAPWQWSDLYQRIIDIAVTADLPLFLEGGNKQAPILTNLLDATDPDWSQHRHHWAITYYRTRPCALLYAGPTPPPTVELTGLDDGLDNETANPTNVPATVLAALPASTVIDPVAGRGLTSRAAHLAGWTSINNELNPYRASAAISRMAKITNTTPERIHNT